MEFKTWRVAGSVTAGTLSGINVDNAAASLMSTSSVQYQYRNIWGILKNTAAAGHVSMSGGGAISLADIATGVPFPCHPSSISASAGTVYLLA